MRKSTGRIFQFGAWQGDRQTMLIQSVVEDENGVKQSRTLWVNKMTGASLTRYLRVANAYNADRQAVSVKPDGVLIYHSWSDMDHVDGFMMTRAQWQQKIADRAASMLAADPDFEMMTLDEFLGADEQDMAAITAIRMTVEDDGHACDGGEAPEIDPQAHWMEGPQA